MLMEYQHAAPHPYMWLPRTFGHSFHTKITPPGLGALPLTFQFEETCLIHGV